MLARLVLPGIAFAGVTDKGQDLALAEAEAVLVAKAGDKRRRDFTLGRHCAHVALERLGVPAAMIGMDGRGAPLWPEGTLGSITHTGGHAASIVARRRDFAALGLDAEQADGVTPRLFPRLFGAAERAFLAGLSEAEAGQAAAVMFSAKEAYYKACLGQAGGLDFHGLLVSLEREAFTVRDEGGGHARGRFTATDGLVMTLVALAA